MNGRHLISHIETTRALKKIGYSIEETEEMFVWERDLLVDSSFKKTTETTYDGGYSQLMSEAKVVRKK